MESAIDVTAMVNMRLPLIIWLLKKRQKLLKPKGGIYHWNVDMEISEMHQRYGEICLATKYMWDNKNVSKDAVKWGQKQNVCGIIDTVDDDFIGYGR